MVITLHNHPLIHRLRSLGLDTNEYVVFGSAPMYAHSLIDKIDDLDVVARGSAWRTACRLGVPGRGSVTGDPVRAFGGGSIEIFPRWLSPEWDTDDLIARAEFVDGIPFAPLADVLKYKKILRRPKDLDDIRLLTEWLELHSH